MSYQIHYGKSGIRHNIKEKRFGIFLGVIVFAVSALVALCFPSQLRQLRHHAFPFWEPEVKQAFSQLVEDVGDGASVQDAAASFCREIIFESHTSH